MRCPMCHQPTKWEGNPWRPFCSERCQLTDLGMWAGEQYRIPGNPLFADTSEVEPETDSEPQEEARHRP